LIIKVWFLKDPLKDEGLAGFTISCFYFILKEEGNL